MSKKVSITLDDEVLTFIDSYAGNRSRFINQVLLKEKQRLFLEQLEAAYVDQTNDPVMTEEIALWDTTVEDGLVEDGPEDGLDA